MAAKSADEARAQAALKSFQKEQAKKAADAKAAEAKKAANKAAIAKASKAKQLAADKAAAAQKKKDDAYYSNFSNPITSAYDPRIALNAGYNPEMAATQMTSSGASPIKKIVEKFEEDPEDTPFIPGSTGFTQGNERTLARNTFINTLALVMGEFEASQPWVNELYDLMQGFINTGSTVEEAQNLALREAKTLGKASKFVQRFDPIFKLQARLNAGEAVQVPTIADYVKSEQKLGDVFRAVGLGELATQEMAAKILGDANKSVSEATAIISDVFGAIDNAPEVLKRDLTTYFPGADRTSIAKALLTGKEGALELTKKVKSVEQLSAAKTQGIAISLAQGADLAAGGADYGSSLGKFQTVKQLERGQSLGRMSGIDFTQQEAIDSAFNSNAAANEKIRQIGEGEFNRFRGSAGRLASRSRAQNLI